MPREYLATAAYPLLGDPPAIVVGEAAGEFRLATIEFDYALPKLDFAQYISQHRFADASRPRLVFQ
jgi:hypothetical protein